MGSDSAAGPGAVLPIYIGDDLTDEDAFDAVEFDGVGIVVRHSEDGDRPSAALFSLESPSAVAEFVRRLATDLEDERRSPAMLGSSFTRATTRLRAAARSAVHRRQRLRRDPWLRAGGNGI